MKQAYMIYLNSTPAHEVLPFVARRPDVLLDGWDMVCNGMIESDMESLGGDTTPLLEAIFEAHQNQDEPAEHTGRSLSVGDVIGLKNTTIGWTFYMVASLGFIRVLRPRKAVAQPWRGLSEKTRNLPAVLAESKGGIGW